jgi:hypothetical protein
MEEEEEKKLKLIYKELLNKKKDKRMKRGN